MLTAWPTIIDEHSFPEIFALCEDKSALAKKLYNAALFRIRQVFTGWEKDVLTDTQMEVAAELYRLACAYPNVRISRVLSYTALEKLMRMTGNPDFFAGLPMQTAQAVVRQACGDFSNWLKSLREYKKHPEKYLGRPRMPHYCKSEHKTFKLTNQDVVLYREEGRSSSAVIKMPGIPRRRNVKISGLASGELRTVTIKPYYGKYVLTFVLEDAAPFFHADLPYMAGADLGTDNIAALACTDQSSVAFKGGVVKSWNQLFAKQKAEAVSAITMGHEHLHADSAHLDHISEKHDCRVTDVLHKISTQIIEWCVFHRVGLLVIGTNPLWKQNSNIGKQNNQTFVSIPHARLRWMIEYKALAAGITVVEQEESYTSRADVTAADPIPVYGQENGRPSFSGKRIARGLYRTASGLVINADGNGGANVLRKAVPDAWTEVTDFSFLANPEIVDFFALNRKFGT